MFSMGYLHKEPNRSFDKDRHFHELGYSYNSLNNSGYGYDLLHNSNT